MDKIRTCLLFKIIAVALISAFIVLDISWAYPPDHTAPNQNLAAWTNFQQKFDESIFSQSALLASVYDIGAYFFGDAERDLESLPSRFAEEAIVAKLGKPLAEADITIENIVPVEYLKETFPEKLKAALDEIGFKGTLPDEGVVFILYKKGDERFLVQVAKKDDVSPENLPGYEWVISDDYVVKYIPEDYVSAGLKTTRAKKDPPHNDDYYKQKARQMLMDWLEISQERSRGRTFAFNHGDEIKVSAPARIPFSSCLSSDHLSVSLKEGGRVLNMGVTINGIKPCYVKIRVLNTNVLRLRRIDKNAYGEKKTYETELVSAQDVKEYDDKDDPFRLAKIILYISGIIDPHSNRSINEIMDELGGGLEIETGHNLSQGGGSSNILSLSAFIAINKLLGRNEPIEDTSKSVCLAELLTGAMGGWQDHLGPYFPALKELHVQPGKIFPDINELDLSDDTRDALKRRLILWDSIIKRDSAGDDFKRTRQMLSASRGPTIALRKWAYEVHRQMIDALLNGDMELLGRMLTEKYDVAKKASPGLRTEYLDDMIADTRDLIEGAASIGSGGGGYCIFIAKKGREESLKEVLNTRGRVCEWAIDKSGFEIEIKRGGLGILKDEQFIHKWQDIFAAMKEDAEISPEKYQSVNLSFSGTRSGDLDLSIWVPRDLDDDLLTVVLKYLAAEINNRIVTWGALSVTVSSDINGISDRLKHYFDEHYDRAHGNAVISKMTGKYLGGERFVIESEGRSRPELEKQTVADDASQSKALDDVNIPVRIVGVNFGHWMTKVGIMQIDESGKFEYISEPARFRTRSGNTDQLDIHSLSETTIGIIRRQMRDAGLSEDDLYAIGISLGLGAVTHGDNVITHESLDSEDFVDMYDNRLSELLRLVYNSFPEKKVFAQNDGKMETFGVSQRYGCRNTLVLKFGNDLASGYIDKDGRITDGVNEFDKVIINLQEGTASMRANKQMSGGAGTYISWSGIENNARMLGLYEKYGFRDEDAVPDILRQWLTEGNREQKEDAVCVFTEVGKCIASLVKSLEQYYHIENVVLSGGSLFGASGREILHSANKALRDESKKITIICDNEMDLKYGCLVGLTYFAQDMKKRQLISKERPLQELFTIVQSTIPESMHGLGNALNDLEPLSEQEDVTADQILEALAEAKETHSPTDEEAKILVESGKPITFAEPNIRTGKDGFTWGELAGDSKILAFLGISASEMNVGMEEPVSECWIASDDEAYPSKVDLGNGPTMSLRELLDMHGEVILGKKHVEEYGPQLGCILKLLDARETLSVAVHPAAGYKAEPGKPERLPKPEMWKMLGPASVYLGLKDAVSPDNLKQAVPQPCESMKKILQKLKKLKWENKTLEKIIIENLRCFDKEPVIKAKLVGNGRLTEAELEELIKFLDTPGNLEGYLNVIDYDPDDLVDVPAATIHAIRGKSERKGYKPNPQSSFIAEWSKSPVPVTTAVAIYDRGDGKRARPNKEDPNATIEVMEQATTVTFNPFEKSEPAALRPVEIYPQDINGNTAFRLFESPVVIVEQMHIAEGADKGLVIEDIRGRGYAIFVENGSIEIHNEKSGSLKLRKGEGAIIPATISKSITIVSLEGKTIMQRWFAPLFDEKEKIRNDTQKSRKAADTTKFSPRRTFVERSKTSPVTPLFELVESAATNRRAEFVKAANELMSNISEEEDPDAGIDKQDLNTRTSAEIKDRVESATQTLYASNGEKVSQDLLATIGNMEKNFARFEADAIMTAIIPLARKFKKEGRKLVLPLETEWIPGYAQSRSLQRDALARSELAKEIRSIPERLRKMGLDNVAIVHKEINESLDRWIGRINNELGNQDRNDLSNIVSLTSETTTTYLSNAYAVSGLEEGKRPLLAGVNPENFEEYYKTHDVNSRDEQLDSQIMEMLAITLELALGKEAPNLPIVASYDKTLRIVIFLPEVKRVNYQELERRYRLKKLALHSA